MKRFIIFSVLVISSMHLMAQRGSGNKMGGMPIDGEIMGKVIDSKANVPIEYANIAIYSVRDSSLVSGGITDAKGNFSIKKLSSGRFYMTVNFIGYDKITIQPLMLSPQKKIVDAGTIKLNPASVNLDGVEVVADKLAMQYRIDKKVINVSQIHTSASGTAIDILEKTPSVTVDIEGNVEMRGSSNFTVLIDGKPSPFTGSDALEQIPASSIENIEIITNPSAKFDPEGTAGIINVITKKSKFEGFSGVVNANLGMNEKYGADILINYRTEKFNVFAGGQYNNRLFSGNRERENRTYQNDTIFYNNLTGQNDMLRKSSDIRAGFDYFISPKTTFSTNASFGDRERSRFGESVFHEYTDPASYDESYNDFSDNVSKGTRFSVNSDLTHKFDTKGHEFIAQFQYRTGTSESSDLSELSKDNVVRSGQKSEEIDDDEEFRIKLDYTRPFGDHKLEAGWQTELESEAGYNNSFEYNPITDTYELSPLYSNESKSTKNIHAMYSTVGGEISGFGYQVGLRAEYTDRLISIVDENTDYPLQRWDFFPTLHLSYQLPKDNQVMASYTRRINRPRGWFLEPYISYVDAYNVRAGNPALKPEYINSAEVGWSKKFGRSFVSLETLYRNNINKIERTRKVADIASNIMYNSFDNVGEDHSLGLELMSNIQALKWWNLNLTGSYFYYKVEGLLFEKPFEQESYNWNARMSNTFSIGKSTRIQFDGMYVSPSVTAQGRREGFFFTNAAVKQDFLKRKLTATLQIRDILGTSKHEFESQGEDFYTHMTFQREPRIVMLTLSYKINNYNQRNKRSEGNGNDMDDGGDDGMI